MCGIAGAVNFPNLQKKEVLKLLTHRGPDEEGSKEYKNVHLFHTRLSVLDKTHGQQPFVYKEYILNFNGEIYNHLFLREQYLQEFSFRTLSDTETLLYLYIKYKNDMFALIDGMFACAILDIKRNKIMLFRDRAGKKPLYFYTKDNQFLFASELNVFKGLITDIEVEEEHIAAYLRNGFFHTSTTPYKYVSACEPAYIYEIDRDTLEIKKEKYFDIVEFYKAPKIDNFKVALSQLDTLLHKSVKERLLSSDLEVGAFLSGGIDSSLIVAIASQYTQKLKTFTVKFDGVFDESYLAKLTAKKYATQHHELHLSMNVKDDIEKILLAYGEPFMDSSAVPSYYVSQEAKKHVSVVLNGDGADELFGGYRRYVPLSMGLIDIASSFSFLLHILPKAHQKKSFYNYVYRLLSMAHKQGLDFYNSATNDIFEDVYRWDDTPTLQILETFIKNIQSENISPFSQMLVMDFYLILQSDLLKKMDIATMQHSLEGRSPFLSKYILEFAPTLQDNFKIKGKNTKYILRELSKKYLPHELIHQPKRGFEVPLKSWVESDLKENIFDALAGESYSQKFIKKEFIEKLLYKKLNVSDEKRAKMLWSMYSLEVWKQAL